MKGLITIIVGLTLMLLFWGTVLVLARLIFGAL